MTTLSSAFCKHHDVIFDADRGTVMATASIRPQTLSMIALELGFAPLLEVVSKAVLDQRLEALQVVSADSAATVMENIGDTVDLQQLTKHLEAQADLLDSDHQAPVVRLINAIIAQAVKEHASDIHLESYTESARVRFRIDGVLNTVLSPHQALAPLLISRIKIMSKLDIAEKRLPQDGRMTVKLGKQLVDLRVSTVPSTHGERVVMRLLEKNADRLSLQQIGMPPELQTQLNELVQRPHGIILVTGPTGSGKTTTLYAALQQLDAQQRNIMTVEDPVEYDLPGISQTQINTRTGMDFAKGLRAILRQDPDVILLGEIRDRETAEISVQASLTGHLVLSTLHTNTALGAVTRLQDLDVDHFLLSSTLTTLIAQRLVRRLCLHCRQPVTPAPHLSNEPAFVNVETLFEAGGCEHCNHTGFNGRLGLFEVVTVDAQLRSMIHDKAGELAMEAYIRPAVPTLRQSGFALAARGLTTVDEVLRVTTL